jgi:phage host-nuclease inhibitor protein Gam
MTANVTRAYDKVEVYLKRFDTIRENYKVNMTVDPEVIRSENDLQKLRDMCEMYVSQMADLEGINETINLGLLQIKQNTFKEETVPVCRNLLAILEVNLPRLAIEMIEFVAKKSEEFTRKLMTFPEETRELVKYLQYLEKCPKNLEKIESDLKYAEGVLQLMKDYKFHIDDEEVEKFLGEFGKKKFRLRLMSFLILDMEEEMEKMAKLVEDKNADISTIYDKLAISLQKDIKKVFDEIEEVRVDVVKDWFLNVRRESGTLFAEL